MALADPCGRHRAGGRPLVRTPAREPAGARTQLQRLRTPREAAIATRRCIFEDDCCYPQECCQYKCRCEAAKFTYLGDGVHLPHADGDYDALRAEVVQASLDGATISFDCTLCDEADDPYCSLHAPPPVSDVPTLTEVNNNLRDRRSPGYRTRYDRVVHQFSRGSCCLTNGCGDDCR